MAGRASVELHTVIFFKKRPTEEESRIVKIRSNGFIVFVPKFGIEGPVYLVGKEAKSATDGMWIVDDENQTIRSSDETRTFKVLNTVRVRIEVVEPQPNRPKLQLTLLM